MDGQTFGLFLITMAFSGTPAIILAAMKTNRMSKLVLAAALTLGFVVLWIGILYLLGKYK